ncbi:MAG: hypothetical protein HQ510_09135 [Candidatus Marinimicrobia bacterium]|nr:hypothetical protein [Candidatus Neomarinimicrobiota bacterium]
MNNRKSIISLITVLMITLFTGTAMGQFKTDRQKELESILMAPCCGSGTMAEHDDNQATLNMKMIMNALTSDNFDKNEILSLVERTYSNSGIYRLGFSPAQKPVREIIKYTEKTVHPGMTMDEIVDYFSWVHDGKIRSMPKHSGIGQLAWKMPAFLLIMGTILISLVIQSYIKKPIVMQSVGASAAEKSELEKRIEKEMKDLNI